MTIRRFKRLLPVQRVDCGHVTGRIVCAPLYTFP
jgi:hypothetical protein